MYMLLLSEQTNVEIAIVSEDWMRICAIGRMVTMIASGFVVGSHAQH